MKARPILFSASMIRALLDGSKTQTRRVVKCDSDVTLTALLSMEGDFARFTAVDDLRDFNEGIRCPYGKPGDLLWVREAWAAEQYDCLAESVSEIEATLKKPAYRADWDATPARLPAYKWKPSIHMPRWASRLTLRITDVRVQRLQEISEADARAEGAMFTRVGTGDARTGMQDWWSFGIDQDGNEIGGATTAAAGYELLWQSINGPGSWATNPFVWAIGFEVIRANVDEVLRGGA